MLAIKGKLEAVDCKISTIETEFLAFIVLPDDRLVIDWLKTDALPAIKAGTMPLLGHRGEVQDAEFTAAKTEQK